LSVKTNHDLVGFLLTCKKMMQVITDEEEHKIKALRAGRLGNKNKDVKSN
jgi:hypothetical protein